MKRWKASIEQSRTGWGVCVVTPDTVVGGLGDTKAEALADLREGVAGMVEYLQDKGLQAQDFDTPLAKIEAVVGA
jgi:predicted RNase H-like HicB family nuclease